MSYRFRTFAEDDTAAVVALWEACGLLRPWNDPYRDIARKTAEQPELFLVAESTDATATDASATAAPAALVGAGMAGYDGHRGWVNYLAVDPDQQGTGLGRAFMTEFERLLLARGCPKVNVQVRAGNERVLGFYASLGYAEDHAVSLGKRLIADD
ncbi:ribosomal protein S18 acetylase RimI-like enzyme [Curtobacterium sp. AG1037]|uniref:GNAT family acetyltransferase n=1 Tax=Curtobacterium sp. AG1037 TaxID=2183990 RepID=UPI000E09FE19|nr:GNAT family acetyltransferase [Curtobacterium sp. AG1037]RDH98446.1 ribosomal protein S18 acetylase RimI-like enzyme [Curtobacterium sp. AG1037]